MSSGRTYSFNKSMVRLILWWLHRMPVSHRRRVVERLLSGCGLTRRSSMDVASQIGREAER